MNRMIAPKEGIYDRVQTYLSSLGRYWSLEASDSIEKRQN